MKPMMLDEIESHFADPPAVRWRREAQYLRNDERKKKNSPYDDDILVFRSTDIKERALQKRERDVARRERLIAHRESSAKLAADRAAAAQAAADACLALSRKVARRRKSTRRVTFRAPSPAPKRSSMPPIRTSSPAPHFRKKSAPPVLARKSSSTEKMPIRVGGDEPRRRRSQHPLWQGPSRPVIEDPLPRRAVDEAQRIGGDLVELDEEEKVGVRCRRRNRVGVRLLRFDYEMCLTHDTTEEEKEWTAKELVGDGFAAAILLDSDDVGPLVTCVETGRGENRETKGLFFTDMSGHRLRVFDGRQSDRPGGGDLVKDSRKCFAEHVFETGRGQCLVGALFKRRDTFRIVFKAIAIRLPFSESRRWQDVEHCCRALASARVQPYRLVEIEHCVRCEEHETTTKHVPGSYEEKADKLEALLRRNFCVVVSRRPKPRLGAFEVRCQSYLSKEPVLLWSKFGSARFPDPEEVAAIFSAEATRTMVSARREELGNRAVVQATELAGHHGAAGALVYLLSPTPCTFPFDDDDDDDRTPPLSRTRSAAQALGAAASALRSWNKKDVRTWLGTVGGLTEEEVAQIGRSIKSGPDLLTLTHCDNKHGRKSVFLDGLRTLPRKQECHHEEGPRADSAWEVISVSRCNRLGKCEFESSRERVVAAHYGSEYYAPSSTPLSDSTKVLRLEVEPLTVEVEVEGGDVELISTRRAGRRLRLRVAVSGQRHNHVVLADEYVVTAGWRLVNMVGKATVVLKVSEDETERAWSLRRRLACEKIQRRFRRSKLLVDIIDEYI